jgi:hypothetical protein
MSSKGLPSWSVLRDRGGAIQDFRRIVADDPADGDCSGQRPERRAEQAGHEVHPTQQRLARSRAF